MIAVEPGDPVDTFSLLDVGTGTPFDVPAGGGPASVGVLPQPDGIDGTWTLSPDGLDDPACLGGATIVIDGTTATMSRPGVATISGTVDGGPQATAEIAESVDGFVIHLGGVPPDEIQLVLQVTAPDRVLGSISPDCDEFVNLTRTGPGGATADTPDADTADAPGGWVAVKVEEGGSTVLTSPDGAEWHDVSMVPGVHITGLAHGAGSWVAFGYTGEQTVALTSRDLVAWTQTAAFDELGVDFVHIADVAYGGGRFLAVGSKSETDEGLHQFPVLYASVDGVTWTELDAASAFEPVPVDPAMDATGMRLEEVDYGDGRFVIAGYGHKSPQAGWPEGAVILYELADGSDQPAVLVPWRAVGDNLTALAVAGDGRALFAATPGEPTANADAVTSSLEWLNGTSTEAIAVRVHVDGAGRLRRRRPPGDRQRAARPGHRDTRWSGAVLLQRRRRRLGAAWLVPRQLLRARVRTGGSYGDTDHGRAGRDAHHHRSSRTVRHRAPGPRRSGPTDGLRAVEHRLRRPAGGAQPRRSPLGGDPTRLV